MSTLFVVATPIGNLSDISERAIATLKGVDLILAEDTRHTRNLLHHFDIRTALLSYHQHSKLNKVKNIIELLKNGKDLALVSDAGTPGIADPGNKLIAEIVATLGSKIKIIPIPGPSAITAAASVAGFPMDRFLFLGFPPAKRKRKKFFEEALASTYPVILYESPHRILKTLNELDEISKSQDINISIVVCRELTKLYEITYRGAPQEVVKQLESVNIKGEFTIIVHCQE